jgi:L-ascorbate metabolism protein UlaG (beta-lactamase superfamily)
MSSPQSTEQVPVRVFGGPTTLIEYGGLRLLTDPTFDPPGDYPLGPGRVLTKTAPSQVDPGELGHLDAVLLSHDQHPDNLDTSGRELLGRVPVVLTTASGAERLGGSAQGMTAWDTAELSRPGGGTVTVTATPAQHGPEGCEPVTGDVIGFLLTGDGLPTVYVSGDNASLDVVQAIADRVGPVDTAVLFAGAARTALFDGAVLTLDSDMAAQAAQILGARRVVAAHCDSWGHFTEDRAAFVAAFTRAGLAERVQSA